MVSGRRDAYHVPPIPNVAVLSRRPPLSGMGCLLFLHDACVCVFGLLGHCTIREFRGSTKHSEGFCAKQVLLRTLDGHASGGRATLLASRDKCPADAPLFASRTLARFRGPPCLHEPSDPLFPALSQGTGTSRARRAGGLSKRFVGISVVGLPMCHQGHRGSPDRPHITPSRPPPPLGASQLECLHHPHMCPLVSPAPLVRSLGLALLLSPDAGGQRERARP